MKRIHVYVTLVGIFIVGVVVGSSYLVSANAQENTNGHTKHSFSHGIEKHDWKKDGQISHKQWSLSNITKDVELIDNGVRVTMTSDDPDTVTRLQEKSALSKGFWGGRWHHDNEKE